VHDTHSKRTRTITPRRSTRTVPTRKVPETAKNGVLYMPWRALARPVVRFHHLPLHILLTA
jgi:hypothetical protein